MIRIERRIGNLTISIGLGSLIIVLSGIQEILMFHYISRESVRNFLSDCYDPRNAGKTLSSFLEGLLCFAICFTAVLLLVSGGMRWELKVAAVALLALVVAKTLVLHLGRRSKKHRAIVKVLEFIYNTDSYNNISSALLTGVGSTVTAQLKGFAAAIKVLEKDSQYVSRDKIREENFKPLFDAAKDAGILEESAKYDDFFPKEEISVPQTPTEDRHCSLKW